MKNLTFKTSKNYDLFHLLPFNRKYEVRKSLIDSFNLYGWLTPIVCVESKVYGKKRMYVIDGQHRLATAKFLNLSINYVIINNEELNSQIDLVQVTSTLNHTSKQWNMGNYIEAYSLLGLEDYCFIERVKGETNLSYNVVVQIYLGQWKTHGFNSDLVKKGKLKITRREQGDKIISYLKSLNNITKFCARMSIGFTAFATELMGEYDHERFYRNLSNSIPMLEDVTEVQTFKAIFEKIYHKSK